MIYSMRQKVFQSLAVKDKGSAKLLQRRQKYSGASPEAPAEASPEAPPERQKLRSSPEASPEAPPEASPELH